FVVPSAECASSMARRMAARSASDAIPPPPFACLARPGGSLREDAANVAGEAAKAASRNTYAHCLPSGLSPSVLESHQVHRPVALAGSRTSEATESKLPAATTYRRFRIAPFPERAGRSP